MPVDFPAKPGTDYYCSSTGMVNVWLPTPTAMTQLGLFMWGTGLDVAIKKIMGDPMQAIISYHIVPCAVPASQTFGTTAPLRIGNVVIEEEQSGSKINLNRVLDPFVDIDLGYVDIPRESDTYMDYDATTVEIYLPFIGVRPLDADMCMGRRVTLRYRINVMTGSCVAMLKVGTSKIYSFNGYCATQLPMSSADFRGLYAQLAGSVIGLATNAATGNVAGAVSSLIGGALTSQLQVSKSGNLSGELGVMAGLQPYLIIKRPSVIKPPDQAAVVGDPIYTVDEIGSYSGYLRVKECHLDAVPGSPISATSDELAEIEQLLKEGVIV